MNVCVNQDDNNDNDDNDDNDDDSIVVNAGNEDSIDIVSNDDITQLSSKTNIFSLQSLPYNNDDDDDDIDDMNLLSIISLTS